MTEQRYPISVRVSGVLVHEKTKLYLTQVLWSDQNDITVYRSFEEYSVTHKRMKKIFPPANALKKSDRTIPKFKDVKMKNKVKKKGSGSKSVQRCKFLEKYCNELLSCDPRVCQNNELITFFHPRDQDLQQDFTKNCLMIVPSEEVKGRGARINSASNITQPFVTETYRCVAPFDTKDTKNRAFKVAVDEKLDVLIKDQAGWWLVENEDKNMAWFPAPYLEKVVDEDEDAGDDCEEDEMDGPYGGGNYIAVRTYKATKGDELSVEIGTQVEVLQKSDNGWWLIRNKGKAGYVPTLFLQPYSNPCDRVSPNRPGSSLDNMAPPRVSAPSPGGSPFQHSISLEIAPVSPRVSPVPHSHSLDIESHHRVPATTRPRARTPSARPHTPSSSSPNHLQPAAAKQRARSLPGPGIGQMPGPHQLNVSLGNTLPVGASTPMGRRANHGHDPDHTTPVITVEEMDAERRWTSQAAVDSEDSFASDSSDFSINGLSSDSADDSSFNLSYNDDGQADHQQQQQQQMHHLSYEAPQTGRHSQQALSTSHNYLSPMAGATLMPATSDPSLYKRPTSPRVPPRPKDKEILTRCSTVTRKNLSRAGGGSPAALQIASR